MHVHLIGVAGTGMGALAGLLKAAGHRVTGSDTAFHPPMGPALERWGIETMPGWDPANLDPAPDRVVVGNVCRKDNPEARAAIDGGLSVTSMPQLLGELFLADRTSLVVSGTHGKTTTTALLAHLLLEGGHDPGLLVGGVLPDSESFRVGSGPFVIEGDEYDTAFFEKTPKIWHYHPNAAVLTTIEHDHIDIYPDEASYLAAFEGFVQQLPKDGLLVAYAGDPQVRAVAAKAPCRVSYYALEGDDTGGVSPIWSGALSRGHAVDGRVPLALDVYGGGSFCGRVQLPLAGAHNARNALAALALATEAGGADLAGAMRALPTFTGVRRRQDRLATLHHAAGDVWVYDDFAHHPSAVRETVAAIRARHTEGRLIALFEPRSATASRRTHQAEYPEAFAAADATILAPVGRASVLEEERLDTEAIAAAIRDAGGDAVAAESLDAVVTEAVARATHGDTVLLMSNGTFGDIAPRLIVALTQKLIGGDA
ncbi:MAG: UDP-N-acetylmuramate:L-alanyl-gamma-D-glutamyl-meso-diaminopimelate ligase [Deltaproteobacteria bacterium]|nr:UDP-N-acetylmuramate:L-alanyl-gamma-D-glutamyl-meso-diaminopimelate ligase [Deltaproteobacteria bacterium]